MIRTAKRRTSKCAMIEYSQRERVWEVVAGSCLFLDAEEYEKYLALMDENFTYGISYYSPDLRKDMVLLHHTKKELSTLTMEISNHVRLPGRLFRQAQLYRLERNSNSFDVTSYVTITHTNLDGASKLFCVARYFDRIAVHESGGRLMSRRVCMDTRDIGPGCHFPL